MPPVSEYPDRRDRVPRSQHGRAFVETDIAEADRETVLQNFLSGQYSNAPASKPRARPSPGFAAQEGFHNVHSFAEIETGKGADALDRRPKLAAALKAARKIDKACPVIVANLDRLAERRVRHR
jgi:hypothetical protein